MRLTNQNQLCKKKYYCNLLKTYQIRMQDCVMFKTSDIHFDYLFVFILIYEFTSYERYWCKENLLQTQLLPVLSFLMSFYFGRYFKIFWELFLLIFHKFEGTNTFLSSQLNHTSAFYIWLWSSDSCCEMFPDISCVYDKICSTSLIQIYKHLDIHKS